MTHSGDGLGRALLTGAAIAGLCAAMFAPVGGCRRKPLERVEPVPTLPEELDPETVAFVDAEYEAERMTTRPLVIFAGSPSDPEVGEQLRMILADPQPLAEREVIIVEIYGVGVSKYRGRPLSPASAKAWQDRFRAGRWEFEAVLVGKDGGVRMRSPRAVSVEELSERIDEMPMRKREMHERAREREGLAPGG